jgi:hypothetical protein
LFFCKNQQVLCYTQNYKQLDGFSYTILSSIAQKKPQGIANRVADYDQATGDQNRSPSAELKTGLLDG